MRIQIDDRQQTYVHYGWNKNVGFSPIEQRILNLVKEGKTVKEIAAKVQRSPREIQRLVSGIKSKLKKEMQENR